MKLFFLNRFFVLVIASLLLACSSSKNVAEPIPENDKTEAQNAWYPLVHAHWTLKNITDENNVTSHTLKSGLPANKVKLTFNKGRVGFHSGCNDHGGSVKLLPNNKLQIIELLGTQMGCEKILQDGEIEFSRYISQLNTYNVDGINNKPILKLTTKNNTVLMFDGELTPETKYGHSKKFTIELIKRSKSNCLNRPCIQWRKLKRNKKPDNSFYEEQWDAVRGNHFWNNNDPQIKDFKAEENRKYILQIKEFASSKLPAGVLWVKEAGIYSARLEP